MEFALVSVSPNVVTLPTTIEKHYTINDLTDLLSMSFERVRQLIMHEPGVLVIPPATPKGLSGRRTNNRTRNSYRIPASVLQRIMRRYANPVAA
jgi:hypothetical protein